MLFNKFAMILHYTVDMFQNEVSHFLDLELSLGRNTTFRKDTNTGLYVNFTSFLPWTYLTSWMRGLLTGVSRICPTDRLPPETNIKRYALWNDFSKSV